MGYLGRLQATLDLPVRIISVSLDSVAGDPVRTKILSPLFLVDPVGLEGGFEVGEVV